MTETVKERALFHVHCTKPYNLYGEMRAGASFHVGTNNNPFFSFYEQVRRYTVFQGDSKSEIPAIDFLRMVNNRQIPCQNFPAIALEIAKHFMMLSRELIFEEIRKEISPDAPSRKTCIWLTDSLDNAKKWKPALGGDGKIFQLCVSGRLFRGDANLLISESEPLSDTYEKARRYWSGEETETPQIEFLFSGTVNVDQIIAD